MKHPMWLDLIQAMWTGQGNQFQLTKDTTECLDYLMRQLKTKELTVSFSTRLHLSRTTSKRKYVVRLRMIKYGSRISISGVISSSRGRVLSTNYARVVRNLLPPHMKGRKGTNQTEFGSIK